MNKQSPLRRPDDFPFDAIPVLRPDGTIRSLAEMNEAMVDFAIQVTGSYTNAARRLGIGRSTLYRYMAKK